MRFINKRLPFSEIQFTQDSYLTKEEKEKATQKISKLPAAKQPSGKKKKGETAC